MGTAKEMHFLTWVELLEVEAQRQLLTRLDERGGVRRNNEGKVFAWIPCANKTPARCDCEFYFLIVVRSLPWQTIKIGFRQETWHRKKIHASESVVLSHRSRRC